MRFCNNKLAEITSFVFLDKDSYFNLTHGIKKEALYLHVFFYVSMCVIVNKEV